VKAIKKGRNVYSMFSAVGIFLTVLLIAIQKTEAAIACGAAGVVALIFLYRLSRLLYVARLICDNQILAVPSSIVTTENRSGEKMMEETVVSTFGLLLGNKVYKWGCNGIHGSRLRKVQMDREHIWLTFGSYGEQLRVELLHGMTDEQSVMEITQKIWYETGILVEVNDW